MEGSCETNNEREGEMIYIAYKLDRNINKEVISETCSVKNKIELREAVLSSPRLQEFTCIEYGRSEFLTGLHGKGLPQ